MQNIPLPNKVEIKPSKEKNQSKVSIQPCHPGYGTTLGNALRRVLLSSLPGGAITAFKIKGVSHEFATIDNVLEDVVEISLNLKQVRFKVHNEEPVRLKLKASGEKKVTAKDIQATSDVEVINTDQVIATLTSKSAELEMDIIVEQGRGYLPTEAREKENTEADIILLDAVFTPVKNVGFYIENVRVGQMTNYENLILEIETDGSITPEQALSAANKILIDHFQFIDGSVQGEAEPKVKAKKDKTEEAAEDVETKEEKKSKKAEKKEDK
ncbi:MAG: DNA-directed RNA polymerase subunit alpha [Patescibacteria group bacterium]|jgi:DNA-directed RNA polymerase subunit alpha|nr:DNA-directed RNA polymerase subunit alpha [Patescibacteria group bacterium]